MASLSPSRAPSSPFIVTAQLPTDLLAWANGLRPRHFPPERNKLPAHVTLFHSFAPSLREELPRVLARVAGEYAPPHALLDGIMDLGKGTALAITSPGMLAIRAAIADHFCGSLTAQDQHEPRLHITIQNKVDVAIARTLQRDLGMSLQALRFAFCGLELHLYCNPHWEKLGRWAFRGKAEFP